MPYFAPLLLAAAIVPQSAGDFRQPQLAASGELIAATFGSGTAVYYSASRDKGRTFSAPVKVAEAGPLALGMHRGPRIAITPQAIVISAVVGKAGKGQDGDLIAWRSTDGGNTWSLGVAVNDVPNAAREGLHAMAAGPNGMLFAVWLDLRHLTPGKPGTELFGASSSDGGLTWSKNVEIYRSPDGSICQCCHPSVGYDAQGRITVMWRNALAGSRDMYLARSDDGGKTFSPAEKLGGGTWKLEACPMDGGGLAITPGGKVVSAWRRGSDVFAAPEGGSETFIASGKNPAIAVNSEGTFIAWSDPEGIHARLPGKTEPVLLDAGGAFPQLVAVPGGPVVAAWENKGAIRFEILR